jgi:hypothetical protein
VKPFASSPAFAWASIALVALVALVDTGCAERSAPPAPPPACSCAPGEPVVDPALLAFLSKARASHHEADIAEDANDDRRAITVLVQLVEGPLPGGKQPPPEVAEVIADTHARLADLKSRSGDIDEALASIAEGLKRATAPTHFRGHLFEIKGIVLERRLEALKAKGDLAGAERARALAIDAFHEAIEIQNKVIENALPDAGAEDVAPKP